MITLIKDFLNKNKELSYKNFSSKLTYTKYEILGVRIPKLRKFANQVAKKCNIDQILKEESNVFEFVLLQGLIIAYAPIKLDEKLNYLNDYIHKIDDWSICDILACTIKSKDKILLEKCYEWLKSDEEFIVRFAIVLIKVNFLEKSLLDEIIYKLSNIKKEDYYIQMAIAWCLQEISVKEFEFINNVLNSNIFSNSIQKKTKNKINQSYRTKKDLTN